MCEVLAQQVHLSVVVLVTHVTSSSGVQRHHTSASFISKAPPSLDKASNVYEVQDYDWPLLKGAPYGTDSVPTHHLLNLMCMA